MTRNLPPVNTNSYNREPIRWNHAFSAINAIPLPNLRQERPAQFQRRFSCKLSTSNISQSSRLNSPANTHPHPNKTSRKFPTSFSTLFPTTVFSRCSFSTAPRWCSLAVSSHLLLGLTFYTSFTDTIIDFKIIS